MKHKLSQATKPRETYIKLGHMIKKLTPGDRMPPFSKLMKELKITQRSLDIAYKQLQAEGVLELKKQSGVFVKDPYASGTFLFVAAEDVFLSHKSGENLRVYFTQLRQKIHHYFPQSRLEIVLTESPDAQHYEREPQLRERLIKENKRKRILGTFISYHVTEQETIDTFDSLDIPFVDLNGSCLQVVNFFFDVTVMVENLKKLGYKKILILSSLLHKHPQFNDFLKADTDLNNYPIDNIPTGKDLVECGIKYIKMLIDSNKMPEAFAICDDYFCQGVLIGAYIRGIRLEEEYGLITISHQDIPIHSNTPIMRLDYCWDEIADTASRIMQKKLRKEEIDEIVIIAPILKKNRNVYLLD